MTRATWVRGDIVHRGQNVGVIRELESRKRPGELYFRVQIVQGPEAPGWCWPEGWRPQLDTGDNPTYPSTCAECGRDFKATGGVDVFCRTCDESGLRQRTREEVVGGGPRRSAWDRIRRFGQ